jgi:hypothetical protein
MAGGAAGASKNNRHPSGDAMKHVLGTLALCLVTVSANAALLSRMSGQAYYDNVSNLTWIADANLARTSGYDADGLMNWVAATGAWPASLSGASYLGQNDWRLPTASEYATLYAQNVTSASPSPFSNLQTSYWSSTAYLCQFREFCYAGAWNQTSFNFATGIQAQPLGVDSEDAIPFDAVELSVWAVRSGDIAAVVPIPAAVWLFGSALGVMGAIRRKISS